MGNWQLRRADEKRQLHTQRQQALADTPIDLNASPADPGSLDGRRVLVRGQWLADKTVLLDNRTHNGVSGVHVITPLQVAGSQLPVLVLRGWTPTNPADRRATPLLRTPAGQVQLEGLVETRLAQPMRLAADAAPAPGERLWQHLDYDRYRAWSGLDVPALVIRQRSESPDGLSRDWVEPGNDVDKHLGYATQWFGLAALVAGLWLWLAVIGPWRRRRG